MRCIVTGGAGFIGTNLVNRLVGDGHEVIVFDNLSTGKQENINKKAKFFLVDISHQSYFEDKTMKDIMTDVDVIFHLAALQNIKESSKVHMLGLNMVVNNYVNYIVQFTI